MKINVLIAGKNLMLVLAACSSLAQLAHADAKAGLQDGDLVGICGDSITEQHQYSVDIADYLLMCKPQPKLTAIQFGWSGEQAPGFLARMKNDMLPFSPTVVTTCYGMNDGGYTATTPDRLDRYRKSMLDIVDGLKDAGVRFIVVGTPGAVDTFYYKRAEGPDIYNKTLGDFGAAAKEVADKEGVAFADVHGLMMDVMAKAKAAYGDNYSVAGMDGVHPTPNGHVIMAYAFLKALGVDGNIATITVDMKESKAESTEGTVVLGYAGGALDLSSTRYPFCFYGSNLKDPSSTRGILPFLPFNQDLNRYTLIVKNPTSPKIKITWGTQSKTYSAGDLDKGINLADEFPDNPFCAPFQEVQNRIGGLQGLETALSKNLMHSLLDWGNAVPGAKEILDPVAPQLVSKAIAKWQGERDGVSALIVPVKHQIKIEAGT
jgi:lysophospholipase L1-like esterase